MKNVQLLLTIITLLAPCLLFAGIFKGKVTDDKGQKLPYATVYLQGTTLGTTANGNGDFELPIVPGLYKAVCQYVGYRQATFNLNITGDEVIEHTFVLKEDNTEMKEVVIHANDEDPAYGIIRSAIKRRKFHLDQVTSFQTSIYLKGVVRSRKMPSKFMGKDVTDASDIVDSMGRGVLFLTEEDADYYSDEHHQKTVIHSVHQSGEPNGLGFSQFPEVITFYANNVDIFGKSSRGFISPISDNALNYYKYKYLGQATEQGNTIYKIQVKQKRAYEPCFNGTIYIVDGDFAIHSLNMVLDKQSGMDLFDTLRIDQLFLPLAKDTWVAKSQVLYFTVNLMGFDITANGVTVYNNQKVNQPIPDSIFANHIVSAYDKTANKKDTTYWNNRPIPLEKDEHKDFVSKDSLHKVITSPAFIDSMRRRGNKFKPFGMIMTGATVNGKDYKNSYSINPIFLSPTQDNIFNYNIVEGFNIAPKLSWRHMLDTGKYLLADVALRYGFSNHHFNSIARLYTVRRDRAFLNRSWMYGVEGGKYVFQYDPDNPVLTWFNTYAALFYRQNDLKIYERSEGKAFLARNYGNGLNWYVSAAYEHRMPLQNTTTYAFFPGSLDGYTPNTPPHLLQTATAWGVNDAALVFASISYKPGFTYTQYPDYKLASDNSSWPRFTLTYDKGIAGIYNSVSNFDKWKFTIKDDVRMRLLGVLKYNVGVGGFLNSAYVSIPDLMHLYGNRGIGYAAPYMQSFQFAQYYDFSNKEPFYGEAHIEYHLKGLLSNKIPLLRQARWYLLFGGNAFYARQSDYYAEAFVGIDNIGWKVVRGLRIDFVQSWDSYMKNNSGIRFGFNLPGASSSRNNPTRSEW